MVDMAALWNMGPPPGGYSFDRPWHLGPHYFPQAAEAPGPNTTLRYSKSDPYSTGPFQHGLTQAQLQSPGRAPLMLGERQQMPLPPPPVPAAGEGGMLGLPFQQPGEAPLAAEAALEGQRYHQRADAMQPHMVAAEGNFMGAPFSELGARVAEERRPFDYAGMMANSGMSLGNHPALAAYARNAAARRASQTVIDPATGEPLVSPATGQQATLGPDTEPLQVSPMDQWRRSKAASEFFRDMTLGLNPATAPVYNMWNAADLASKVPGQAQAGDMRAAALSTGGAILAALGARGAGGGAAERYAQEAAAGARTTANPLDPAVRMGASGRPEMVMGRNGMPVTERVSEPGGFMVEKPLYYTQSPGTQLGMFFGPGAMTADKDALLTAIGMDAAKRSREDIWKNTGWFRGTDNKWRFEVPDTEAKLAGIREYPQGSFASEFIHPRYEAAYGGRTEEPGFRGMWSPEKAVRGEYRAASGSPSEPRYVFPYISAEGPSAEATRSAALHEYQHHVQQMEGFSPGGNRAQIPASVVEAERARLANIKEPSGWENVNTYTPGMPDSQLRYDIYRRLAGEVEARNVQTRADFTPEERLARPPWTTEDVPQSQQLLGFKAGNPATVPGGPFNRTTFPKFEQAARADRHNLYNQSNADAYKAALGNLTSNNSVPGQSRHYFGQLYDYAFRPSAGNKYANSLVDTYMNMTGGNVSKHVPIEDFHNAYLDTVKQRMSQGLTKAGTEHYTKGDIRAFKTHLYQYGREVGEKFPETPTRPSPWLIDPKKNTVAFSPYLPQVK